MFYYLSSRLFTSYSLKSVQELTRYSGIQKHKLLSGHGRVKVYFKYSGYFVVTVVQKNKHDKREGEMVMKSKMYLDVLIKI